MCQYVFTHLDVFFEKFKNKLEENVKSFSRIVTFQARTVQVINNKLNYKLFIYAYYIAV